MQFFRSCRKALCFLMMTALLAAGVQAPATAGMIGSETIAAQSALEGKRAEVEAFVARDDVARALLGYGVDAADVKERVASLTDAEVLQIHARLDELPAGGSVIGAVLGIIVIFMLLDMAGVTDIFPRI